MKIEPTKHNFHDYGTIKSDNCITNNYNFKTKLSDSTKFKRQSKLFCPIKDNLNYFVQVFFVKIKIGRYSKINCFFLSFFLGRKLHAKAPFVE